MPKKEKLVGFQQNQITCTDYIPKLDSAYYFMLKYSKNSVYDVNV